MYKIFSLSFIGFVFISAFILFFVSPYNVENDDEDIKNKIENRINKTEKIKKQVTIKEIKKINNSKIIFFEISEDKYSRKEKMYGLGVLKKGIFGKHKIVTTNFGPKDSFFEIVKTNKGKFLVFAGFNKYNYESVELKFETDSFSFKLNEEFFIKEIEIKNEFEEKKFPELIYK